MSRGLVYVAAGETFVNEAKESAKSAKGVMPDLPITIITDQTISSPLFDTVLELDTPRCDGGDRIFQMLRSPYERTLFVDTDIYFSSPVWEVYDLLDQFELGVAHNGEFFESLEHHGETIPQSFPEYNGGVLLYSDCTSVCEFQKLWKENFLTDAKSGVEYNQPALRKALYESEIRFTVLPREYNCIFRRPGHVSKQAKIFHGRLIDLDTYGAPKRFDVKQVAETINSRNGNRVFYHSGSNIKIKPSRLDRLKYSLKYGGITETLRKVYHKLRQNTT